MTHDEMIAVLTAAKEGKQIQIRGNHNPAARWVNTQQPLWDFSTFSYRVEPERITSQPYRRWLTITDRVNVCDYNPSSPPYVQKYSDFKCWIDKDWITSTVDTDN